jgi:hypothetical protein
MKIHRKEIAKAQLQTAISLFLNRIDLWQILTRSATVKNAVYSCSWET